mmetsp:Transcript_13013/g.15540  ORF Transcript_13013/g.15540 Transcript_13013/m.15540 type:complete len:348 (-) Transcript_13013:12-1055(-)
MASHRIFKGIVRSSRKLCVSKISRTLDSKFFGSYAGSGRALEFQSPNHIASFADGIISADSSYNDEPTEKQIQFAEYLATQRGIDIPIEAKQTSLSISLFIEESLASSDISDKPSDKQIQFVKNLCQQKGDSFEMMSDRIKSKTECSLLINELLEKPNMKISNSSYMAESNQVHEDPTPNQLSFLQKLCTDKGIDMTSVAERMKSKKSCSDFIAELLKPSTTSSESLNAPIGNISSPSPQQLSLMVKLAQNAKIGIPFEALENKKGASEFIAQLISSQSPPQSPSSSSQSSPKQDIESLSHSSFESSSETIHQGVDNEEPSLLISDSSDNHAGVPLNNDKQNNQLPF